MNGENNLMLRPVNWPTLNSVEVFIHRMVKLNCPHCDGTIELDDDAYGDFECPLCEGEFEFGEPSVQSIQPNQSVQPVYPHQAKEGASDSTMDILTGVGIGAAIFVLVAALLLVLVVLFFLMVLSSFNGGIMGS
tara:strand:+ start:115 stop:516 length:402 start_codon:yes stop_codon:yes gene_type:complete